MSARKQDKPVEKVIDAADEKPSGIDLLRVTCVLILFAFLAGFVVGVATLAVLRGVEFLQEVVWDGIAEAMPSPLSEVAPVLLCLVGGVAVGLCTKKAGFSLDTLGKVIADCREKGGYELKSVPWALALFVLPIAFGGAVGPEAGTSGFVAALITSAIRKMRLSGVAMVSDPKHPFKAALSEFLPTLGDATEGLPERQEGTNRRYTRGQKTVLWAFAGVGFVLGIMALAALLGPGSGLPRCEAIDYLASNWLVGILALAVGYLMVLLARGAGAAAKRLCGRMGIVSRAVMCGAVLGVVAVFLPDVLFSGQAATGTLIDDWQTRGAIVLLATCAAKICLTQLCVQSGWVGGEFFPLIFCGMCAGYAIAAITGVDAMLPVAMATGAVVGGCTRKPVLTTCVLALCFPLVSLPVVALAAFVAAKIPVPSPKAAEKDAA